MHPAMGHSGRWLPEEMGSLITVADMSLADSQILLDAVGEALAHGEIG